MEAAGTTARWICQLTGVRIHCHYHILLFRLSSLAEPQDMGYSGPMEQNPTQSGGL